MKNNDWFALNCITMGGTMIFATGAFLGMSWLLGLFALAFMLAWLWVVRNAP